MRGQADWHTNKKRQHWLQARRGFCCKLAAGEVWGGTHRMWLRRS